MSIDWYADVKAFHEKFGCLVGDKPSELDDMERLLRVDMEREERFETQQAILNNDLPGTVDGIADQLYLLVGRLVAMGVDARPIWDEVHRTNMAKEGGGRGKRGKILKPEGWKPPRIKEILEEQQ